MLFSPEIGGVGSGGSGNSRWTARAGIGGGAGAGAGGGASGAGDLPLSAKCRGAPPPQVQVTGRRARIAADAGAGAEGSGGGCDVGTEAQRLLAGFREERERLANEFRGMLSFVESSPASLSVPALFNEGAASGVGAGPDAAAGGAAPVRSARPSIAEQASAFRNEAKITATAPEAELAAKSALAGVGVAVKLGPSELAGVQSANSPGQAETGARSARTAVPPTSGGRVAKADVEAACKGCLKRREEKDAEEDARSNERSVGYGEVAALLCTLDSFLGELVQMRRERRDEVDKRLEFLAAAGGGGYGGGGGRPAAVPGAITTDEPWEAFRRRREHG